MKKKLIRLTESDLHNVVKESILRLLKENDLSYSQIRNISGIYDDDYLNASVEGEQAEELEGEIITSLGGLRQPKILDFNDACKILKDRFGFDYVGPDEEEECHIFKNGKYTIYLYPKTFYPKQGKFVLFNLHLM